MTTKISSSQDEKISYQFNENYLKSVSMAYELAALGASCVVIKSYFPTDKNIELSIDKRLKFFRCGDKWISSTAETRFHANVLFRMYVTVVRDNADLHRDISCDELLYLAKNYLREYQMAWADVTRIHYMFRYVRDGVWSKCHCRNCSIEHIFHANDKKPIYCPFCLDSSRLFRRVEPS